MAKSNSKHIKKSNPLAFGFEFVGSIIYILLLFLVLGSNSGSGASSSLLASATLLWLPLLFAAAVISAIMLFFLSFANLMQNNFMQRAAGCAAIVGGFSLVALSVSNALYIWIAVIGFIIAIFGVAFSMGGQRESGM